MRARVRRLESCLYVNAMEGRVLKTDTVTDATTGECTTYINYHQPPDKLKTEFNFTARLERGEWNIIVKNMVGVKMYKGTGLHAGYLRENRWPIPNWGHRLESYVQRELAAHDLAGIGPSHWVASDDTCQISGDASRHAKRCVCCDLASHENCMLGDVDAAAIIADQARHFQAQAVSNLAGNPVFRATRSLFRYLYFCELCAVYC